MFVCFVCLSWWDLPTHAIFHCTLKMVGKLSTSRSALRLFYNVHTYGATVNEYFLNQYKFNKIKIKNFNEIWGMLLLFLENVQWTRFDGGNFIIFIPNAWEIALWFTIPFGDLIEIQNLVYLLRNVVLFVLLQVTLKSFKPQFHCHVLGIVGTLLIWKGALKQFLMFRTMMQKLFNIK